MLSPLGQVHLVVYIFHRFERGRDVHDEMGIRGDVAEDALDPEVEGFILGVVDERLADRSRLAPKYLRAARSDSRIENGSSRMVS